MSLLTNIVAYWKFDESSGNAIDSVGGLELTTTNVTYSSARINNGINANGLLSTALLSHNLGFTGNSDWSCAIWIKAVSWVSGRYIHSLMNNGTSNGMNMYITGSNLHFGKVRRGLQDAPSIPLPSTGTRHFLVATFNSSNNTSYIYQNGNPTPVAYSVVSGNGLLQLINILAVGCSELGLIPFNGSVDGLGHRSRLLTNTEMSELYNRGEGLQYPFTMNNGTLLPLF